MSTAEPLVSAVIPTHRRPELVVRAVRSACAQTVRELEVIVVMDGADESTSRALSAIADPRVRVVVCQQPVGNAEARNVGVASGRGEWVAFLDDDDVWLPAKLERQLEAAGRSAWRRPIVSCRLLARSEWRDLAWPRRLPEPGEPIAEYLFCRRSLFSGEGVMPTSTLFVRRELVADVPFRKGLLKHVDPDWLLRAVAGAGVGIQFAAGAEPLAVWHIEERRSRISNDVGWQYSLEWIRGNRHLVTRRAYAGFLLTVASLAASRERDWRGFTTLLREASRHGRPSLVEVAVHAAQFAAPDWLRRALVRGDRGHDAREQVLKTS